MKRVLTSIKLPDYLLKSAKKDCKQQDITFTRLIEDYLRIRYKDRIKVIHEYEEGCNAEDVLFNPKVKEVVIE